MAVVAAAAAVVVVVAVHDDVFDHIVNDSDVDVVMNVQYFDYNMDDDDDDDLNLMIWTMMMMWNVLVVHNLMMDILLFDYNLVVLVNHKDLLLNNVAVVD